MKLITRVSVNGSPYRKTKDLSHKLGLSFATRVAMNYDQKGVGHSTTYYLIVYGWIVVQVTKRGVTGKKGLAHLALFPWQHEKLK